VDLRAMDGVQGDLKYFLGRGDMEIQGRGGNSLGNGKVLMSFL
jgi:hypothetical protein